MSRLVLYFILFTTLLFFLHGDGYLTPEKCTIFVGKPLVSESSGIHANVFAIQRYESVKEALTNTVSGDVVCLMPGTYSSLNIANFDGGSLGVVVMPLIPYSVTFFSPITQSSSISISKSKNITVSGFYVSSSMYGIFISDSSNIFIRDNYVFNTGQEGIVIKSFDASVSTNNISLLNNFIFNTGENIPQYGEGIYIGNAEEYSMSIVKDIIVEGNFLINTNNESIDVKANVHNVKIVDNFIFGTSLYFNGAITIATAGQLSGNLNVEIVNNIILGVDNVNGFNPIGIAIGSGNISVLSNYILDDSRNFVGICLFTTFVNVNFRNVVLLNNHIFTTGSKLNILCGSGGTRLNYPASVIN